VLGLGLAEIRFLSNVFSSKCCRSSLTGMLIERAKIETRAFLKTLRLYKIAILVGRRCFAICNCSCSSFNLTDQEIEPKQTERVNTPIRP